MNAVSYSRDYYKVLGVQITTSQANIKKAYKKLAMKYHPDKANDQDNNVSEEHFKSINEAYSVLSDQNKRRIYDHGGYQALQGRFNSNAYHSATYSNFNGKSKKQGILDKVNLNDKFVISDFARELRVDIRNLIKILELMLIRRMIKGKIEAGIFIKS